MECGKSRSSVRDCKKKIAKKKLSHQTSVYCDYVYEKRVVAAAAAAAVVAGTRSWINFPLFAVFIRSSCARVYLTYWRQSAPSSRRTRSLHQVYAIQFCVFLWLQRKVSGRLVIVRETRRYLY